MLGRDFRGEKYRFGFNGQEKVTELGGGIYTAEFWMYNAQLGRRWNVDPETKERIEWTPYNAMRCNPLINVDPNGALDIEYDKDGNKLSDLGGDKIDFHHQANGDTKIVDRSTGNSNMITGGEKIIRGYTHRDSKVDWATITREFLMQQGTTYSLFSDFSGNSQSGPFKSLHSSNSSYSGPLRKSSLHYRNKGLKKGKVEVNYAIYNPITSKDMWEQMWGRPTLSWYELGDKTLFLMTDSKSFTSLSYRLGDDWERKPHTLMGNSYQTYIWVEHNSSILAKASDRINDADKKIKQIQNWDKFGPHY
jgi:RHS repeat-associated protein